MKSYQLGDVVDPGSGVTLADLIFMLNVLTGTVAYGSLTSLQKRLFTNNPDGPQLNDLIQFLNTSIGLIDPVMIQVLDDSVCCDETLHSVVTSSSKVTTPSVNGIGTAVFEDSGLFCFGGETQDSFPGQRPNPLIFSQPPKLYLVSMEGTDIRGLIYDTREFSNNYLCRYMAANGDCYAGTLEEIEHGKEYTLSKV